jgi:hypothetical protein
MALFFVFLFWLGGYLFFLLSFNQFWCFCCFGGFSCPVVFVLLYFLKITLRLFLKADCPYYEFGMFKQYLFLTTVKLLPDFKPGVPNLNCEFSPSICYPDFNRITGQLRMHHQVITAVAYIFSQSQKILRALTLVVAQICICSFCSYVSGFKSSSVISCQPSPNQCSLTVLPGLSSVDDWAASSEDEEDDFDATEVSFFFSLFLSLHFFFEILHGSHVLK